MADFLRGKTSTAVKPHRSSDGCPPEAFSFLAGFSLMKIISGLLFLTGANAGVV